MACDGTLFEALSSCLSVCSLLNLNTTKPRIHDFAFKWRGKSPDRSFLVPEKWSPAYLSYNNALKALVHVDNAKVSQLAATV